MEASELAPNENQDGSQMRQGLVNGQFDQRISKHLVCLELPRLGWLKAIQGEEATAQLHSAAIFLAKKVLECQRRQRC